jgi:hypothetical protein
VGASSGILPYYVVSIGKTLCLWKVHETAEKVLRSRAYTDLCNDYRIERKQLRDEFAANKLDIQTQLDKVKTTAGAAAVKTVVDEQIKDVAKNLGHVIASEAAVRKKVNEQIKNVVKTLEEVKYTAGLAAAKKKVDEQIKDVVKALNDVKTIAGQAAVQKKVDEQISAVANALDDVKNVAAAAAAKGKVMEGFDGVQVVLLNLTARIVELESKQKPTPDKPPNPQVDPDNSTPTPVAKWKTYTKDETLDYVAMHLLIEPKDLADFNINNGTRYKDFFTRTGETPKRVVVFVPEILPNKRPYRFFATNHSPTKEQDYGKDIAKYFGIRKEDMGELKTTKVQEYDPKKYDDANRPWKTVELETNYHDSDMKIPTIPIEYSDDDPS